MAEPMGNTHPSVGRVPDATMGSPAMRWFAAGFLGGAGVIGLVWVMLTQPPSPGFDPDFSRSASHSGSPRLGQVPSQMQTAGGSPDGTRLYREHDAPSLRAALSPGDRFAASLIAAEAAASAQPSPASGAAEADGSTRSIPPEPVALQNTPEALPAPAEPAPRSTTSQPSPQPPAQRSPLDAIAVRIDVNSAGLAELDRLPGIGPALATRIIDSRTSDGPFRSLQDLTRVRGIGEKTAARLATYVRFD